MTYTTVAQLQQTLTQQHPSRAICYQFDTPFNHNDLPNARIDQVFAELEREKGFRRGVANRIQALEDQLEAIGTLLAPNG